MQNTQAPKCAVALNTIYFGAAAAATIFIVARAWDYGFFFTPFPAILTALSLMFLSAAGVGVSVSLKGHWKLLALAGVLGLGTICAYLGVHQLPQVAYLKVIGIFVALASALVAGVALIKPSSGSAELPAGVQKFVRSAAVLLPLPILAYALLAIAVELGYSDNIAMTTAYIKAERALFGVKRADHGLNLLASKYTKDNKLDLAGYYAEMQVDNAGELPLLCLNPIGLKEMQVDACHHLVMIRHLNRQYAKAELAFERSVARAIEVRDAKHLRNDDNENPWALVFFESKTNQAVKYTMLENPHRIEVTRGPACCMNNR